MKELEILNIQGVDCYEQDGVAYLKLENVARGLGFIQTAASGNEVVRWERVKKYLAELGVPTSGDGVAGSCNGSYKDNCPNFIPENIFYRLAMKAKNEVAEKFQAKVADEIIPSIRKHGGYIAGQESLSDEELLERAVLVAKKKIVERDRIIEQQKKKIEENQPKVLFADAVAASYTSILVGDLAKLIQQNGVKMGSRRLFAWMRENGYLMKRSGSDWNLPTQRSMELGLFEVKESTISLPDGSVRIIRTTKVTGKGQQYFLNKFLGKDRVCQDLLR